MNLGLILKLRESIKISENLLFILIKGWNIYFNIHVCLYYVITRLTVMQRILKLKHFTVSLPAQCLSQAVLCLCTPRICLFVFPPSNVKQNILHITTLAVTVEVVLNFFIQPFNLMHLFVHSPIYFRFPQITIILCMVTF